MTGDILVCKISLGLLMDHTVNYATFCLELLYGTAPMANMWNESTGTHAGINGHQSYIIC